MSDAAAEPLWRQLRGAFEDWTGVVLPDAQWEGALGSLTGLARLRAITPTACLDRMGDDRELRQQLIDTINLGLTWFLRDRDGLVAMARDIASAHANDPERGAWVWSIGCSTGEEPYSLAMLLDDFGIEARILATDINRRFLGLALDAVYPDRALRRVPDLYRHRYFEPAGAGRVRVRHVIRRRVTFELHNIAESQQPPRGWSQFDGVVCRNLLMFLDRARALSILRGMTAACRPGGYIVLGAIERPLLWATRQLDVRDAEEPIVQVPRHVSPRRMETAPMIRLAPVAPAPSPAPARRSPASELPARVRDAYDLVQAGAPTRALAILDAEVENHPLSPLVQLSRGLALKQTGKLRDAVTAFRAARFLDAETWLAPYQLGLCLEALGDADDACEAYRHAMSVLERGGRSGLTGLGDDIETLRLSISSACRSRLQTLARQTAT